MLKKLVHAVVQPGRRLGKEFLKKKRSPPKSRYKPGHQKSLFGESLGEGFGMKDIDRRRYEILLHPDDKGTRHGFDAVLRERKSGRLIVVEHKGQGAKQTPAQGNPEQWIKDVNRKTINRQGKYAKSTEREIEVSRQIEAAKTQGMLEYQLHRTQVDRSGRVVTTVEKELTFAADRSAARFEPAVGGPVRTSKLIPDPIPSSRETSMKDEKKPVPPSIPPAGQQRFINLTPQPANPHALPRQPKQGSTSAGKPAGPSTSMPSPQAARFIGLQSNTNKSTPAVSKVPGPPSKQQPPSAVPPKALGPSVGLPSTDEVKASGPPARQPEKSTTTSEPPRQGTGAPSVERSAGSAPAAKRPSAPVRSPGISARTTPAPASSANLARIQAKLDKMRGPAAPDANSRSTKSGPSKSRSQPPGKQAAGGGPRSSAKGRGLSGPSKGGPLKAGPGGPMRGK